MIVALVLTIYNLVLSLIMLGVLIFNSKEKSNKERMILSTFFILPYVAQCILSVVILNGV